MRLALVTLLQFWEALTDRQAADALRTRIDWKYLLCLDLTDGGFDHSVLSEFRTRLVLHSIEHTDNPPLRVGAAGADLRLWPGCLWPQSDAASGQRV